MAATVSSPCNPPDICSSSPPLAPSFSSLEIAPQQPIDCKERLRLFLESPGISPEVHWLPKYLFQTSSLFNSDKKVCSSHNSSLKDQISSMAFLRLKSSPMQPVVKAVWQEMVFCDREVFINIHHGVGEVSLKGYFRISAKNGGWKYRKV